jgi:hypothetical protein
LDRVLLINGEIFVGNGVCAEPLDRGKLYAHRHVGNGGAAPKEKAKK